MQRKLTDALSAMVETGLVSLADTAEIVCTREVYSRIPMSEEQLDLRERLVPTIESFQRLAERY